MRRFGFAIPPANRGYIRDPESGLYVPTIAGGVGALVQTTTPLYFKTASGGATAPKTISFGANVTAGNTIIVVISEWQDPNVSISDNLGNTYTDKKDGVVGNDQGEIWSAPVTTGGACTISIASSGFWALNAVAFEVAGITALDAVTGVGGSGTSTTPSHTLSLSQSTEFVVGLLLLADSAVITPGWGAEAAENETYSSGYPVSVPISVLYREVTDGAQQTFAWTLGTSRAWVVTGAAWKVTPPATDVYSGRGIGRGIGRGVMR